MSDTPDGSGLLGWIIGTISVGGALWGVGRRIFNTVTRTELEDIIKAQDKKFLDALDRERKEFLRRVDDSHAERLRLHQENRETSSSIFNRLQDVEKGVASIQGELRSRRRPRTDS